MQSSYRLFAIPALLFLLTTCAPNATLQATIEASNTQLAASATARATASPIVPHNTATPTDTPTHTPTPCCGTAIVEVTPCGAYICETTDNQTDIDILARLCVVEVRGFGAVRDDACVSVVSTVTTRMFALEYSDGTVRGTILWGCTPENSCPHFPGHVVNGCRDIIPEACAWSCPDDITHFRWVVDHFLRGHWGPSRWCSGYTYYGSREIDMRADACIIDDGNGHKEAFYN